MDWIQSQNWQLKISSAFTHKQERVIITAQLKWPKKLQFSHPIRIPIWLFFFPSSPFFAFSRSIQVTLSLSLWFGWKERATTASKSKWVLVKCFTTPQGKKIVFLFFFFFFFLFMKVHSLTLAFRWNAWTIWTGSNLISYFV